MAVSKGDEDKEKFQKAAGKDWEGEQPALKSSLNCLVIGGTGKGKSRGFMKSNIYSLLIDPRDGKPVSFVFTVPKKELCNEAAGFLEANGYGIRVLNINEQHFSDCYNSFCYIRSADSLLIMVDCVGF